MKISKFGGSSLASSAQLEKVFSIIQEDPERRFVVVSAPGKRTGTDEKVTDLLFSYYQAVAHDQAVDVIIGKIQQRYLEIAQAFHVADFFLPLFTQQIESLRSEYNEKDPYALDRFLAAGENLNAQLVAACFNKRGLNTRYIHPEELGLIVSNEPQHARLLQESYARINQWKDTEELLIIPGFFGCTKQGDVCTFSRGGSDITGSIVAAGLGVSLYENFTDVDGIFAANPNYIHEPALIECATYREIRELTYAGFTVFHDEALIPSYKANIPVVIKNTNNPAHKGTLIKDHFEGVKRKDVVGIASDHGFGAITIGKYLLNREIGIVRKILQLLEDFSISFEHMPSGIDDISILLRTDSLSEEIKEQLFDQIRTQIEPDHLGFETGLSVIALVGEQMRERPTITSEITAAFARKQVKLRMISQGADERSIIFAIPSNQERAAVRSLYYTFFD